MLKLPMISEEDSFVNPDICGTCKGACCQNLPGAAFPKDFGAPNMEEMKENLMAAFASGQWAIDWWEGDARDGGFWYKPVLDQGLSKKYSRTFYVRPAVQGQEGEVYDPTDGGVCTFHTDKGCSIFESRPTGCRGLKPGVENCEVVFGGKREACLAWYDYQNFLVEVAKKFEEMPVYNKAGITWTKFYLAKLGR